MGEGGTGSKGRGPSLVVTELQAVDGRGEQSATGGEATEGHVAKVTGDVHQLMVAVEQAAPDAPMVPTPIAAPTTPDVAPDPTPLFTPSPAAPPPPPLGGTGQVYGLEADLLVEWDVLAWLTIGVEVDVLWPGSFFPQHDLAFRAIGQLNAHAGR